MSFVQSLETLLRTHFAPVHLDIVDESAQHAGHRGAGSGGHYRVTVVSTRFEGQGRLERHRMVYEAVGDAMQREIHALAIVARTPDEWAGTTG